MAMNRRNVLIGLGAIAAGGGAAFGSGAFSQVDATRNVSFSLANDNAALLQLNDTSSYASTESGSNGQSILRLDFGSLNDDARSQFDGVFEIVNNSDDGLDKDIDITHSSGSTVLDFQSDGSGSYSGGGGDSLVDGTLRLAQGNSISVRVIIDSTNGDPSSVTDITISASSV